MNSQFLDFKIIHKEEIAVILNRCKGLNKRQVFLLYDQKEIDQLPFLSKILAAVKLDLTEDLLVLEGDSSTNFSFFELQSEQQTDKVIIFGYAPKTLGIHLLMNKYEVSTINDCQFLFADDLEQISNDKQLKGKLWGALKKMF